MRADIEECMAEVGCPECHGKRLKKTALAVTVGGMSIADFSDLSVVKALDFIETDELLEITPENLRIRKKILDPTLRKRAGFKH